MTSSPYPPLLLLLFSLASAAAAAASSERLIKITNNCTITLHPGVLTTNGSFPANTSGFHLPQGSSRAIAVPPDWVGRIWGRTNCAFDPVTGAGTCGTGDCGGKLECGSSAGVPPATLAEFTMAGHGGLSYYDVSIVDGYDLDMSIIPANRSANNSPSCIMTSPDNREPPHWCPFDLLLSPPPKKPYTSQSFWYPDDHLVRPSFSPCLSACAKWHKDKDCCSGKFDDPEKCHPGLYSKNAKKVCPDAYSFAYDDRLSTFTVPEGGGGAFEVVFCPGGESSRINAQVSGAPGRRGGGMTAVLAVAAVSLLWVLG